MANKERLKEIKGARKTILDEESFQKKCIFLYSFDELGYLDWLIEQAEKVERYKQALEFYADENNYVVDISEVELPEDIPYAKPPIVYERGIKARKALEG